MQEIPSTLSLPQRLDEEEETEGFRGNIIDLPGRSKLDINQQFVENMSRRVKDPDRKSLPPSRTKNLNAVPLSYEFDYAQSRPQLVINELDGRLHGPQEAFFDSGSIAGYADYTDGNLSGVLLTWNENGSRKFFGQFRVGNLNGFACIFKNNNLIYILEASGGKIIAIHILGPLGVVRSYKDVKMKPEPEEIATAIKESNLILTEIKKKEVGLKNLATKLEELRRHAIVVEKAPDVYKSISDHIKQQHAIKSDEINYAFDLTHPYK